MNSLVRAELIRLQGIGRWWKFCLIGFLVGAALTGGIILLGPERMNPPMPGPETETGVRGFLSLLVLSAVIPAVFGSQTMTDEFHHGTIIPTVLAQPRLYRVVFAKLVTHLLVGLAYGLMLAIGAVVGIVGASSILHVTPGLPTLAVAVLSGRLGLAMALYTVVGVGIGAIVRRPTLCLGILVGWFYLAESFVSALPGVGRLYPYLPGGAASAVIGHSLIVEALSRTTGGASVTLLPPWAGGLLLIGYAVLAAAVAVLLTARRDIR